MVAIGRRQRRYVLVLRRMEGIQQAGDIDDRPDIGTIITVGGLGRDAELLDQVHRRAGGQRLHH